MSAWTLGRDPHGVPTVVAGSLDDLAHGQGVVTAHDRAWQLQVERWRSQGRLAAHVGAAGVAWDTFARQARLDDTARRCFEALDAGTRCWFEAYVAGVQEGLVTGAPRSPELRALSRVGVSAGRWEPWHPLGVFLVQHVLFGTVGHKLWRAHVARTFASTSSVGPGARTTGPCAGDGSGPCAAEVPEHLAHRLAAAFTVGPPDGSNAVAVTGARTASGAPLVAGDPHRLLERPGLYQQVHLVAEDDDVDVVGLAFPGVPGVAHFGHTGTVAWAVTNAMADYQDLYRERLERDDDTVRALGPDGWEPVTRRLETLEVRDAAPVTVEVLQTARGPVVAPRWRPGGEQVPGGDDASPPTEALSLRQPSQADGRLGLEALPALLRARTVDDVAAALASWVEPVNSVLVADTAGEVRQLVAGQVPVREPAATWRPVPAWAPQHAWQGRHRVAEPLKVDDRGSWRGLAVTANDERADVAHLGAAFAPPDRATRLREQLEGRDRLTVDDMADVLLDTVSAPARRLLPLMRAAAGDQAGASAGWDARMDASSPGAAAFAAWRSALVALVVDLPVLAPLGQPVGVPEVFAPWLSPTERVGSALEPLLAVLPDLGVDVLALARRALTTAAPTWGATHRARFVHGLDGTAWASDAPRDGDGTPVSGDTDCVLATSSVPGLTDRCLRGPVARYVWDLADRDASRWVVPLGADGAPGPHHGDQTLAWAGGALVPVPATSPRSRTPDPEESR